MKSLLTLAACSLVLVGCASSNKTASAGALNAKCPFSGNAANAEIVSECKDGKVAFCCNGCKGKFDKMTDQAKAEMAAKAYAK